MPSPVVSDDFDNTSFTGSICDLFRQKILNNDKMVLLLSYLFQADGDIGSDFATDLMELLQPIGTIVPAPVDLSLDSEAWLKCEGQAVSRTTYARLFAKLGTTFGIGDGITTFNIPDLRDKFLVGASGTKTPGSTGGADSDTINLDHTHIFGDHYNANDDGRFIKGSQLTIRNTPASYSEIHGNTGSPNESTMTDGNFVTDLPYEDLSSVTVNTVPSYVSMVMYIKSNHKIAGSIL